MRLPEEAYAKAVSNGENGETDYTNLKDQSVEIRFRGISKLDVVYDPFEDGAELCFEEQLAVPESETSHDSAKGKAGCLHTSQSWQGA